MLETYQGPADLKKYSRAELDQLAQEIRKKIIEVVATNGGHLAPSLGAVDLAVSLHAVLDTPTDKIVWDVGHQAYAHKILTGRLDRINTIRTFGGISGFPKREESVYDSMTVGHASTSISAALGMASARDIKQKQNSVFAVIGDGALSGGLAMEALNNAEYAVKNSNFVVILNDNCMSISKPVGRLNKIFTTMRLSGLYNGLKGNTEKILKMIPMVGKPATKIIEKLVDRTGSMVIKELGNKEYAGFLQDLGFTYIGPIDGHNITMLMSAIRYAKKFNKGPLLLHVMTKKGKGYLPAENDPTLFHGIGCFDIKSGEPTAEKTKSYTKIFSEEIVRQGEQDKSICAITAAMPDGTGLQAFADKYPKRFFDVGIAEEHAVTFSAGLSAEGFKPVLAIYSTFLQRSYDQLIHDISLQKLSLFLAIDRAGLVGQDGPTHHGVFDLSFLRHIPNIVLAAPADGNELKDLILSGLSFNGLFALRYPRGEAPFREAERAAKIVPIGKGEIVYGQAGAPKVIWAIGSMVIPAIEAAQKSGQEVCVVNARFVKPLDKELLQRTVTAATKLITVEENVLQGGFGSAVLETLEELKIYPLVERLGIPDRFIEQGTSEQLLKQCGLTAEDILQKI